MTIKNKQVQQELQPEYNNIQLGEIMKQHEAETREIVQIKVTKWLHNNPADMQMLMWDFQEELESNLSFSYSKSQFRCWIWDTIVKDLEK
jgi:hypothetical protein